MTLASTLKQRQKEIHQQLLEGQLRKLPIIQEAIEQTEGEGYSPTLPIEVIVESLKDTSLIPPSQHECIGYEFIEKDGEYHIYRRVIKGINTIANEDTEWTIKDIFELYNIGAYVCNAEMIFYE
jgi:hypothetical protein